VIEDLEVDITTCEKIAAFVSSDEDEEDNRDLLFLPIIPEIEEPEDTALNLVSTAVMTLLPWLSDPAKLVQCS